MGQLRISTYLKEAKWVFLRRWFPISKPLFHGTSGPKAGQIMRGGFKSDVGGRDPKSPAQVGISTSRNLDFMLEGHFGNYILVLDEDQLKNRHHLRSYAYPDFRDELETRIIAKRLSPDYIQGLIVNGKILRREGQRLGEQYEFPIIHKPKGRWEVINEEAVE